MTRMIGAIHKFLPLARRSLKELVRISSMFRSVELRCEDRGLLKDPQRQLYPILPRGVGWGT